MTTLATVPVTDAGSAAGTRSAAPRDRYIDSLRALALVRVVVYHFFGWAWLTIAFPSIPIMFALAGALVAGSLDRASRDLWGVLRRRIRRLLPPLWVLGLVAVPLMLAQGWTVDTDAYIGAELTWSSVLLWIVPITDPPGSVWGQDWTIGLWYIRAYLWFLIMSPALLWLFRRWPGRTMAVPAVGLLAAVGGVWDLTGPVGDIMLTTMTYLPCWLLGFAHHDNRIRTTSLRKVLPVALVLMALGLTYVLAYPDPVSGYDIDEMPLALSLWGTGVVLLLLRFYPDFSWMARVPVMDKLIAAINARAMTIYLWNNPAIFLAAPLAEILVFSHMGQDGGAQGTAVRFTLTWVLVIAAVLLFGWVEDVAAKRRIRINPWPRGRAVGATSARGRRRGVWLAAVALLAAAVGGVALWRPALLPGEPVAAPPVAAANALPERVVAGYWQGWGTPTVYLRNVPTAYNVVLVAFAVGDGSGDSGRVSFSQSVQTPASFVTDVDTLRAQGRDVLLSVGGAQDGDLALTNPAQREEFVASVIPIIDRYHFSGIDWDLEHGFDPVEVAAATRTLKERYGPEFAVTSTPTLSEEHAFAQQELARLTADILDLVMPQFYNGGQTDQAWIVDQVLSWGEALGPEKVVPGFMTTPTRTDTGIQTPEAACAIVDELAAQAPGSRGVMTWSINLDKTKRYAFVQTCLDRIRAG